MQLLQEEITHCAAGVRWLSHLHKLAHESPQTSLSHGAAQNEAAASTSDASEATTSGAAVLWMEEARQYARVEQWFHALVKRYFKGSLKVSCS